MHSGPGQCEGHPERARVPGENTGAAGQPPPCPRSHPCPRVPRAQLDPHPGPLPLLLWPLAFHCGGRPLRAAGKIQPRVCPRSALCHLLGTSGRSATARVWLPLPASVRVPPPWREPCALVTEVKTKDHPLRRALATPLPVGSSDHPRRDRLGRARDTLVCQHPHRTDEARPPERGWAPTHAGVLGAAGPLSAEGVRAPAPEALRVAFRQSPGPLLCRPGAGGSLRVSCEAEGPSVLTSAEHRTEETPCPGIPQPRGKNLLVPDSHSLTWFWLG